MCLFFLINLTQLKEFTVLKPDLDFQLKYLKKISSINNLKYLYKSQLADMDSLFASIQDKAFKGEL